MSGNNYEIKNITLNEYQLMASRTDVKNQTVDQALLNGAMGMIGESAEVMEHIKKVLFQGHEIDPDKLVDEAGDVLWYIAKMGRSMGVSLEEIAMKNIAKLAVRYPDGFKKENSIERVI